MPKLLKMLSIVKYLAAAVFLIVPLYSKFPFINVPGTFVSIRLEDFLILLASLVIFGLLVKDKKVLKKSMVKSILLYLAVGLLSLLSAILITKTVIPHIGLLHWLRRIEYFIPLFLGFFAIKSKRSNLAFFINLLIIVILASFIYGFGQKHFSWPIIITQNLEYSKGVALRWIPGSHINSSFAGHYDLATFLVFTLPIIVNLMVASKKWGSRIILFITFFSGLWLMVNAASRISILSYLVAVTLSLFLVKKYKEIVIIAIISLLFVGFSSNLLDRYFRIFDVLKNQIGQVVTVTGVNAQDFGLPPKRDLPTPTPTPPPVFEDRSTSIRLNVEWPRALRAFSKNPLLGIGYSSITLATDNDYLRLLGETGFLGFIAFFLIFVDLASKVLKKFPLDTYFKGLERTFIAGFAGAIPGIMLNAVFIDIFEASKFAIMFWLITGMAVAILDKNNE